MRLTHMLRVGAAAAALALTATACGGGTSGGGSSGPAFEAGTTMDRIQKAGKMTAGTKFDQPLFGLKGLDGKPVGFDVEISKIIAGKIGVPADKVEFVEAKSAVREEILEQKKTDIVVSTYTINEKRKERISFAGPYYEAAQDLMVKSDNNVVTGPESLKAAGIKVCSVTGSASSTNVLPFIDPANQVLFDGYSKCADALRNGQVGAVTTDDAILLGFIADSGGAFKLVGKKFSKEPYGIGIAKGDVKFCDFIDKSLKEAKADGSYDKAWAATAGKAQPTPPALPTPIPCT